MSWVGLGCWFVFNYDMDLDFGLFEARVWTYTLTCWCLKFKLTTLDLHYYPSLDETVIEKGFLPIHFYSNCLFLFSTKEAFYLKQNTLKLQGSSGQSTYSNLITMTSIYVIPLISIADIWKKLELAFIWSYWHRVNEQGCNIIIHHFPNMSAFIVFLKSDVYHLCKIENSGKDQDQHGSRSKEPLVNSFHAFTICLLNSS